MDIHKTDWKQIFSKKILERGFDYYLDGAVEKIVEKDSTLFATVCGTARYLPKLFESLDGEINSVKHDWLRMERTRSIIRS